MVLPSCLISIFFSIFSSSKKVFRLAIYHTSCLGKIVVIDGSCLLLLLNIVDMSKAAAQLHQLLKGSPLRNHAILHIEDFITIHNYKSAITDLNRAIELTPDFTLAYLMRAIANAKNAEVERLSSDDDNTQAAAQLAAQKAKMTASEIIADLDHVIKLSPRMAIAYYNKGYILAEMQDYTSALSAFTKAIELKADMGEAYYNRGYVYLKLGNKDAGIADLSKAGELGIIPSYNLLKRMAQ